MAIREWLALSIRCSPFANPQNQPTQITPGSATRCRAGTAGLEGTVGLSDEAENLTKAGFLCGRGWDVKWAAGRCWADVHQATHFPVDSAPAEAT